MTKERIIFETRLRDYTKRAMLALEAVNRAAEKFNSYGSCFGIWDKEDVSRKCTESYIKGALLEKIARDYRNGVSAENIKRHKYKYGLIERELLEPAKEAKEAIRMFGRLMIYDSEKYCFIMDGSKLEKSALRYADNLE